MQKILFIFILASTFITLNSCKKDPIQVTDITGVWIENTEQVNKSEIEILIDGSFIVSYEDTDTSFIESGIYKINSSENIVNFEFSWGIKTAHFDQKDDLLNIDLFYLAPFFTSTPFKRK